MQFRGPFVEMFFDRVVMGLRPTQGDEKRLLSGKPVSMEASPSPLSSRAQPRDLQFRGPFVEMFFDRAYPDFLQGRVCGSP